ncbi:hypothetical protein BDV95DRAFT_626787 [Massariosphaeria phaeospora]|uniref:Fe2OG dioxygenase domain-containing protein n=1 Tax=Massariosphaeria phaeospora TaxID=100035 RepID=A0A7C8IBD1_9PLEO|nr:hypothetical protein BDV95DRAFT_626787 [Massariosphaeria phaeospora]
MINSAIVPILDLSHASHPNQMGDLLRDALFDAGFLYVKNHGVEVEKISNLPFLGCNGFAEETTLGKQDLREQFNFVTEIPVTYKPTTDAVRKDQASGFKDHTTRDFSRLYWQLRGLNQGPSEHDVPGFHHALTESDITTLEWLCYRFVHLVEEALGMPEGTFYAFFQRPTSGEISEHNQYVPPQHRIKFLKYSPTAGGDECARGIGAHKDSSGWLTFLYQVGQEKGLEVLDANGEMVPAPPIQNTFVVNFSNAFEAATGGLPLDLTISEIQCHIPLVIRKLRQVPEEQSSNRNVSNLLDARWDSLGESQLRN